jgi:tRNA (uracil-5-)-methyltransferase
MISLIVSKGQEIVDSEKLGEIRGEILKNFKAGDKLNAYNIESVSIIFSDDIGGGYKEGDECDIISGNSLSYTEDLLGYKFTVSPFAFFQVNTNVFEKMLNEISSFLNINENTIVFDVCCGTGAIGICLSKNAKKVVGFELVEAAVENARKNVELNKDTIDAGKCEYFAGRAEVTMPDVAR